MKPLGDESHIISFIRTIGLNALTWKPIYTPTILVWRLGGTRVQVSFLRRALNSSTMAYCHCGEREAWLKYVGSWSLSAITMKAVGRGWQEAKKERILGLKSPHFDRVCGPWWGGGAWRGTIATCGSKLTCGSAVATSKAARWKVSDCEAATGGTTAAGVAACSWGWKVSCCGAATWGTAAAAVTCGTKTNSDSLASRMLSCS